MLVYLHFSFFFISETTMIQRTCFLIVGHKQCSRQYTFSVTRLSGDPMCSEHRSRGITRTARSDPKLGYALPLCFPYSVGDHSCPVYLGQCRFTSHFAANYSGFSLCFASLQSYAFMMARKEFECSDMSFVRMLRENLLRSTGLQIKKKNNFFHIPLGQFYYSKMNIYSLSLTN